VKKKIAIIFPPSLPVPPIRGGSIQTIVYERAVHYKEYDPIIFCIGDKDLPSSNKEGCILFHRIKLLPWETIELKIKDHWLIRYTSYIYKIIRILKKDIPDVIEIHNRPWFVLPLRKAFGKKVKIINMNHNQIFRERTDKRLSRKIFSKVDALLYPSNNIARLDILNDFPELKTKTYCMYNSVDIKRYHPDNRNSEMKKKWLEKLELNDGPVLLFAGRLVVEKGIDKLIEAFKIVLKKCPQVNLVLAGSSFFEGAPVTEFQKNLKEQALSIKNNVFFTGYIDQYEIPYIYALSDIFISPVVWDDPSPKTCYEAAAAGIPIISTRRGGIAEIVKDGETGLLLDTPYENQELADVMLKLIVDKELRVKLGRKSRLHAEQNYTHDIIAAKMGSIYKKLLSAQ
jgi:glycosyltransferase involved in cell wall biosynthesis